MADIVVVGAGVIGLTAAWEICAAAPHLKVTVVAEHDPESQPYSSHYTSPWAGAHFRPFPAKNAAEHREYPYTRATVRRLRELAEKHPECSVRFVKGREYFERPDALYRSLAPGYTEGISGFRLLEQHELPAGAVMGAEYDSFVLNPPVYLQFLQRRLRFGHGVTFATATLDSLRQAAAHGGPRCVVVNCSGRGLQWGGGYDPRCYPIRGQTLLINAPANTGADAATVTHQSRGREWTFYIPRPLDGGVVLGGTKQPHDTFAGVRDEDTQALLRRGAALFPQLMKTGAGGEKYFDVVRANVGFRPARAGGSNVSVERCDGHTVVHGYGFGGSGFEMSFGAAQRIRELVFARQGKL